MLTCIYTGHIRRQRHTQEATAIVMVDHEDQLGLPYFTRELATQDMKSPSEKQNSWIYIYMTAPQTHRTPTSNDLTAHGREDP